MAEREHPAETEDSRVPGLDSPIQSIREIQQERKAQGALGGPGLRQKLCTLYYQAATGQLDIESPLPPENLLAVLGQAYLALRKQVGGQSVEKQPLIHVP